MNYASNNLPSAYIAVGKNKSRLKIYNGKDVFVKDGEEFQIEIFNPTTKTIGAKILINGNSISSSLFVIKPGERSYLERYLDDNKKFLFETYEVENSKEAKAATKENGIVRIEFYNEKVPVRPIPVAVPYYQPYYYPVYYPGTITIATPYVYCGGTGSSGVYGSTGATGSSGITGTTNLGACTYTNNTDNNFSLTSGSTSTANIGITTSSNAFYCNDGTINACGSITTTTSDLTVSTVETGRIEKGSESDQYFSNYYGDFETYKFASNEYKLLPESHRPKEVKEIRQYCTGCRTRIKKASWTFCPSCGEKLD